MFKDRYTVGNVCLVVFLAFIFSVFMAIVKVEPVAAEQQSIPMEPTQKSGSTFQAGTVTVSVDLHPLTPLAWDTLDHYVVTLKDEDNNTLLTNANFVYDAASQSVYASPNGNLLRLTYSAPGGFSLAPSFSVAYVSAYYDTTLDAVYLTLIYKPPADGGNGGGGGGGGGAPTGPVTVISDVGDLTLTTTSATLETNAAQLLAAVENLQPGQPLVMPVAPEQIRPNMEYTLPGSTLTDLGDQQLVLPGEDADLTLSLSEIPAPTIFGADGATLQITLSRTDGEGANIGFANTFGSGDFVAAAPSFRLEISWVSPTGVEERVSLSDLERLFKFTVAYDPNVVTDPSRLAGIQRDDDGNVTTVPRTVVNTNNHTVDLYLNHLSYYSVVQSTKQFNDIASHWANSDIVAMAARDIINGQPNGNFEPNSSVTRAQFAAMLVRTLGKAGVSPETPKFKDAPKWAWYYSPVETAVQLGLVTGYSDGTYKPDAKISRQEMAAMIVRAMTLFNSAPTMTSAEVEQTLKEFVDQNAVQTWARESTAKAVKTGIVQGRTLTSFQPASDATRAEAVVMLKRLLKHHGHIQ